MKAVRFHEYGDPQVLRVEEVEVPAPGPGEVLVRVAGTSFNSVDANIRPALVLSFIKLMLMPAVTLALAWAFGLPPLTATVAVALLSIVPPFTSPWVTV